MKRALVIPADVDQPCTTIEWDHDRELLAVLYGAIGCDTVDAIQLLLDGAELTAWVDDNGLLVGWVDGGRGPTRNTRVEHLMRGLGYQPVYPIVGTVVLTEGADEHGATLGLRDELLHQVQADMARATAAAARAEHLAWCKQRALAELDAGSPANALASVMSDLGKHPGTAGHAAIELGGMLALAGHLSTDRQVREWIEGIQ